MAVASYDAQINLLVSGQRELDRLTDRLRSIERQIVDINRLGVKPQQRDPVTGRFGADPDRENRIRLARIQRIGKEEERRARLTSASLRTQNSELERSILLQSKLNSAVDLYERKLEELSRGGGGARLGEDLQAQIRDIRAAYQAATDGGTKNLSLVRSLATELGRVVERQNEINRLSSFQSKAFYDTQRFERRIAELRRAGADASAFSGVGGQMKALRSAQARGNESEAKDAVRRIREALDRIARNLDETIREARTQQSAQKAARSWETFFEEASTTALLLKQNQKNASAKFAQFFEDAANQALQISQNAKDTRKSWQFFFEDAQKEADRLRTERLSNFARLRGNPNQYSAEAGPLPTSRLGSPRYFAEAKEIADQLLIAEDEIAKIRKQSLNESLRLESERLSLVDERKEKEKQIKNVLLEAVSFGKGSQVKDIVNQVKTGGRNALVRGGLGLGALGAGGLYEGITGLGDVNLGVLNAIKGPVGVAASAIGDSINSALGGVPAIINSVLSGLGDIPGVLGLAAVAAYAFAPAMKTAGEAVYLAGQKFGETKFGKNIKLTLDRQTNIFESGINAASQMTMPIDASGFDKNLEIRQSAKDTSDTWRVFFEDTAAFALQLKQNAKDTSKKWTEFFQDASYQALQIKENNKSTRKSWQVFFEDAASQALLIKQQARETAKSWQDFFEDAANQALQIKQNAKATAQSWRSFFENAASEALRVSQEAKNTSNNWRQFFEDAAYQALQIKQNGKDTGESWRVFFEDAAYEAFSIKEKAKSTRSSWQQFFEDAELEAKRLREGKKTGLQSSLDKLQEARGAGKAFLGGASPAEAIDKIVREFNTGKPEISNTAKNLVTTYASEITAGIPAVADAMKNLGIAGIRAIKKALRMASPSRVMLEIAKNQIDTYVGFLRAALPAVEAAAKAVGEAGTPKAAGIPKEAIRTPLTEKARTRPLTNEAIERNKITASFAASQITGPLGQLEQVQARIEDFINKTRTSVDLDKLFAGFSENARFNMAGMGKSAGPDFDKLRAALADFYQVPVELTPDLDRGVNAAKQAGKSADQLERYVLELVGGLENISDLFKTAAKLPTPSATVKTSAAATASIVIPDPWETVADTISNSAIDAAVAGGRQIEQGVNSITSSVKKNIIEDPWADVVSTGSGGAIPPNTPPGRRAGSAGDARNNQVRQVKDLLGLDALADISRVSTRELEALSSVASELRAILDPTIEGFDRLDNQLRETIGSIDRQLQRRDQNADFLTRRVGPRTGRAISEGLIGGAFPLLFGQGAGASLGGLLGGAAGGFAGGGLGFGLSLVGTALGTQIDAIAQSATELGAALENPAKNFDALKEKSFFTSKALEKNIEKLVEYGDAASASALVQQDAIKQIGTGGIEDLRRLSEASDKLNRAWAELTRQIQVAIAGPLADLLNWVSALVNKANEGTRRDAATVTTFRGLSKKDQAAFNAEVNKRIQAVSGPSPTTGLVAGADANALAQPSQLGPTPDQISKIRAEVAKLFQGRSKTKIEISLEAQAQSKVNSIQKQLESIDIFRNIKDQVKQVGREQEDLQKQSFELARSYEESIGEIRQRIEDEVAARRFANLQKANEIADQQGQNRIKQLQLESSIKASELQSSSDNPAFVEAAKQAAAIVSQFSLEQLSAEEEAAKIKRDAALEAKKIDFESVKFKVGIEKELSRLNIETAKRVADINQQVKRRNEEYDANKFRLEKTLAEIQLKNSEVEANIRLQAASSSLKLAQEAGDQSQIRFFSALKEAAAAQLQTVSTAQQDIAKISAPQKLQPIAGVKIQNVDFSSVLKEVRAGSALLAQQLAESLNGVDLSKAANLQNFKKDFDDIRAQIAGPLNQSIKEIQDSRSDEIRYINLISNGLSEINARKTIEIEKEIELQRVRLQGYIAGLENQKKVKGQSTATIQAINSQIKQFQGNIDALPGIRDKAIADARAAMQPVPGEKIATAYEVAGQKLDELINKENQAIFAAQTISDAFSGAFREIIAGTATAQEILSGFFQNLANSFADMAAQIIAEMIKMYILQQLLNVFSGGGSSIAKTFEMPGAAFIPKGGYKFANGGMFANGIKPFAMGGVVNSPTLFKFANGGAMSTGVMGEAGPEAILPLSRGSDGKLGVTASGSSGDVNVTVNVDAKGTSVQGNDQSGNQLGRAISAAVQQEIIKQRRPGGLLNK